MVSAAFFKRKALPATAQYGFLLFVGVGWDGFRVATTRWMQNTKPAPFFLLCLTSLLQDLKTKPFCSLSLTESAKNGGARKIYPL